MSKKAAIIFLCSLFFLSTIQAQNSEADMTGKELMIPPDAAAFTQYGKMPVSQFTGIPDIKVPMYDIKVDNFELPVYLSYYARGIQPNVHAGWVGTGWNLFAEAVITRKINGASDEWVAPYLYGNYNAGDHLGWYWQHGILNNINWSSQSTLTSYVGTAAFVTGGTLTIADPAPDEFDFNIFGISGAFFMGEDGVWKVRSRDGTNIKITETVGPYTFTALPNTRGTATNVAQTFTQFILTTGNGTQFFFGGDPNTIEFNRAGVRYTINTTTIATSWHLKKIVLPSGKIIDFEYFRDGNQYIYNPNSRAGFYKYFNGPVNNTLWTTVNNNSLFISSANVVPFDVNVNITDPVYLKSISFPSGKLIFNSTNSSPLTGETDILDAPFTGFNDTGHDPANIFPGEAFAFNILSGYANELIPNGTPNQQKAPSKWYQLNDVELLDENGNELKDIKLTYTEDPGNTRLFLRAVQTTGFYNNTSGISLPPYTFLYNTTPLPKYCTLYTDHWGFYNGPQSVNPLPNLTTDANGFPDNTFQAQYMNFREPNLTYTEAGILTQVNFPTGGSTQFQYESNQYMSWVGNFPPAVTTLAQPAVGGGLRIRKIISQDGMSSTPVTYEYSYVNNLTNNISSGVLGMPRPTYFDIGSALTLNTSNGGLILPAQTYNTLTYKNWSSTAIFPSQNDDGNIVTYTNVFERQSGNGGYNGLKQTTFSNHDNGYLNNPPDAAYWLINSDIQFNHFNDRSFERGNILSEIYADSLNNLIKTIAYSYNTNPNRFSSYVKGILYEPRVIDVTAVLPQDGGVGNIYTDVVSNISTTTELSFIRASAIRFYTFYPYLEKTVETDYSSNHTSNTAITTTTYTYDSLNGTRNMVKTVVINSKGELVLNNFRFPLDFNIGTATDGFSKGIKNLQNISAVGLPVEKYTQKSNSDGTNVRTVGAVLNFYDPILPFIDSTYQSEIVGPRINFSTTAITASGVGPDSCYKPKVYIDNYDSIGNVLQQHKISDVNVAYQWGYNSEYPIARVVNATNTYRSASTKVPSTGFVTLSFAPNIFTNQSVNFTTFAAGTIMLTLGFGSNPGSNTTANASYQLVGPTAHGGQLCTNGCNFQSTINFPNLAAGNYTLTVTPNLNSSLSGIFVSCAYSSFIVQVNTSGIKEFFYDGFEENSNSNVVSGSAHTGNKYWGGSTSYTVNYSLPNTRSYVIQWWSLAGSAWTLNERPYTGTMTLTGMIDDIRIFPADARMSTYTYAPLVGMTSQTDAGNRVTYYEYDGLQRLKRIRDQDYNILKSFDYQYQASSVCGGNCYIVTMQTLAGTNTLGYPVGVFNVHDKLLGNATGPVQYASLWNADTADARIGTLAAGGDSLHFNMTLNAGMSLPSGVTGCRYYQVDLAYNRLDGVRNFNGAYIDFGDGTGMRMGKNYADTPAIIAPNTTYATIFGGDFGTDETYFVHTYADSSLRTLTCYHNDAAESEAFDNLNGGPTTGLQYLSNLRGNLPQNTPMIGGSCYQMASMTNLTNVLNWNSITTVQHFQLNKGDGYSSAKNISYAQDFMKNNRGLIYIYTSRGFRASGYLDPTFKLTRLKSDWNTYFTDLQNMQIGDDQWNREDLSALTKLNFFQIWPATQDHQDSPNSPLVSIPSVVIDNILNQIAAGAGQTVTNGAIDLESAGTARTSASDTSVTFLKSKGWVIAVNGIQQ